MIGRFFKLPTTRRFEIKPRYYDERKEALDKRIAQIKAEMGITDEQPEGNKYFRGDYRSHIKGQMKGYFRETRRQKRSSNIRLFLILMILLALTWFIIYF